MSQWEILATDDPNKTLGQRHIEAVREYFHDKGEEPRICTIEGCDREVLVIKNPVGETVEFDKCIFHADKENEYWYKEKTYKIGIYNATIPDWNSLLVRQFWKLIREFKNVKFNRLNVNAYTKWGILEEDIMGNLNRIYKFSKFIFPKFQSHVSYTYNEEGFKITTAFVQPYKIKISPEGNFIANAKEDFNFWNAGEPLVFNYNVGFSEAKFIGKAYFEYIHFKEGVFFNKSAFLRGVDFYGSIFQDSVYFNNASSPYIIFDGAKFHKLISIDNSYKEFEFLSFKNAYFSAFSNLSGSKISTNKIILKNARIEGLIQLSSITTCEIDLENTVIISSGKIVISINKNCTISKMTLKFPLSSDGIIITDSDLRTFKLLHFDGNIEDVRFINVNWGEVSKERFCPYITDYRKKRDIFRQIKLALDKQENYIDARKFYALEMWAYGRELWEELKSHWNLKSFLLVLLFVILASIPFFLFHAPWGIIASSLVMGLLALTSYKLLNRFNFVKDAVRIWENFTEMIIYWFYQITSNFGLSWKRPILWLIIITPIYFESVNRKEQIRSTFERLSDSIPLLGKLLWQVFDNLNYISAKFLQSISQFNSSTMQSNYSGVEFITLLYYSFSAYLIYQFIMAIRRKVRR